MLAEMTTYSHNQRSAKFSDRVEYLGQNVLYFRPEFAAIDYILSQVILELITFIHNSASKIASPLLADF